MEWNMRKTSARRQLAGRLAGNQGFTLVEVLISMMVLVALTLIFAASVPAGRKAAIVNGQYSQAISLCQHKIDQVRAVGYGRASFVELNDAGFIDGTPTTSPYSFELVDGVETFLPESTATLATDYDPAYPNQITVTATITWKNITYQAKTSTISVSAIIANVE